MAAFKKFEDILAWRKAAKKIYEVTSKADFAKDFALRDQIRRSIISVMANIAEGHGRNSKKEFANFLNFAHGPVLETQSHLYMALDLGYMDQFNFNEIYGLVDEVSRMVMGLMRHLKSA